MKALFPSKTIFFFIWCFLAAVSGSCEKTNQTKHASQIKGKTRIYCDPLVQKKWWATKTQAFATLSLVEQKQYVDGLKLALNALDEDEARLYRQAIRYFTDVMTVPSPEPYVQLVPKSLDGISILQPLDVPEPKALPFKPITRPTWDGVPIPAKLEEKAAVVYRGEARLRKDVWDNNILAKGSPFWVELRSLFSEGIQPAQKKRGLSNENDAFTHVVDSTNSMFVSTSTNYEIALQFGRRPRSQWSVVIEAVVQGLEIETIDRYFRQLDFLHTGHFLLENEYEISVYKNIPARSIRGVWLESQSDIPLFIPNPNWDQTVLGQN